MGDWIIWIGAALFIAGFVGSLVAVTAFPSRPGARLDAFMRGSFQSRADYSPTGWRILQVSWVLALAGFTLVVLAIYVFEA